LLVKILVLQPDEVLVLDTGCGMIDLLPGGVPHFVPPAYLPSLRAKKDQNPFHKNAAAGL
jgi:hypothetical protein